MDPIELIVVGGGVIGCAISYYLAESGVRVTLLERGAVGQEATSASAGMLTAPFDEPAPPALAQLQRASLKLYPQLIPRLEDETGIDVEYKQSGLIRPAYSETRARILRDLSKRPTQRTEAAEWVEGHVLRQLEPRLTDRLFGAAYSPGDADLNPALLAKAFAAAATGRGVEIRQSVKVTGFAVTGDRVTGVRTSTEILTGFDAIVLAGGSWTRRLAAALTAHVPTKPIRGQMVAYRSKALRHLVWGEDGYLVPKQRGLLYAGATVEDVGFRPRTTVKGVRALKAMAGRLVPALRRLEIASDWAGLRPGSADGLPILGPLPAPENAYVATGHFRSGILLAPITGKLISEQIVTGSASISLDPFSPGRFVTVGDTA